jgi:light-regulated signal transduction histidine kinase (bacteriophytochrome)
VFTGYIRDLTERRLAEQAALLRREKDAAEAANRELEAFSYSVAHDLRSPLRAISGFSTILLEDHQISGDAAHQLKRVVTAAHRMDEMIDALLGLSRLSRGELQLRKVNVSKLAGSIIDALRATAPDRHVDIAVAADVEVYADPELLRIALENLLGNAWKFTRNRSQARIEVGAVITESVVCCHVRDDGAGFDMKYADKLFGPFQRLHTLEQFEGHGIGLATVQRIAMRHGGRVWAESTPDHGATFYLELPLHPV